MNVSHQTNTPLKVGVVGLGWAGQQHLAAYKNNPHVEIVALAGMETELLKDLQEQYEIPNAHAGWEDMLDAGGLDAVSVAVPTFLHAPIAIAALDKGIHVLSEKPIARTSEEGERMVAAARASGKVLDVAFNHRRRGDIKALKNVVAEGAIGRPYYAKGAWLRRNGIPTIGSWFTNPDLAGGGPLIDIGVHVLDYSLYLLGNPKVLSVSAVTYSELGPRGLGGMKRYAVSETVHKYEVEDFSAAFLRLDNGITLVLEAGWASFRSVDDEINFHVYGTEGGAELRVSGNPSPEVGELIVYRDLEGEVADEKVTAEPGGRHQEVINDFIDVLTGEPDNWASHDGSLALEHARVIDACYQSAREGREISLA